MTHPLTCQRCNNIRFIEYKPILLQNKEKTKGIRTTFPFFICRLCGDSECVIPASDPAIQRIIDFMNEGEYFDFSPEEVFIRLNPDHRFKRFDYLGFEYDPRDYYIIPGLYREQNDGYLTPVFFDKDVLLYYNNHPDYTVKLTSFSSGTILHKGKEFFAWGFGINRSGKIFKWLGDLDNDFSSDDMKQHLRRFQASNVSSDNDVYSKFYLSQNPFSVQDMFQYSDNEARIFSLVNEFNENVKKTFIIDLLKIDINQLSDYYKPPILEEREQVFNAYISLNKFLIENLQEQAFRKVLLDKGVPKESLEKDSKKIGSMKLFTLFIKIVLNASDADNIASPLFILNDLRQLQGHLSGKSFNERYDSCKKRLQIAQSSTDLEVYQALISKLVELYTRLIDMVP